MWVVEFLNETVIDEFRALPDDMRARFQRIVELIEQHGLEQVREPYVKHLEGAIWKIRLKGRDGISRALYVTARGKKVVVVRFFIKKTQKTPRHELDIAHRRAKEVL